MNKCLKANKCRRAVVLLLCFFTTLTGFTRDNGQITLRKGTLTLRELFGRIEENSDYTFLCQNSGSALEQTVSMKRARGNVSEILDEALKGTGFGYEIVGEKVVIRSLPASQTTKKRTIKGKVLDEKGETIIGANVWLKETSIGVATDINGEYTLTFEGNYQILVASFIGYKTEEVVLGDKTTVDFKLVPDSESLEEVVVVGYGSQKKESVIGSISSVGRDELQLPSGKISTNLAGQMAGVVAVSRTGEPGEAGSFYIRGISSFNDASQGVLVLVDGVERSLDGVDPEDIESFSILKDATATAVYGVRGANGVMLITTRKGKEGKPQITARAEYGILSPTKMPKMVNSTQFAEMVNEVRPGTYSEETIKKYTTATGLDKNLYPDINWMKTLFKDYTSNQRVNLNVSGGGSTARYFIAGSFYNENSIYKNDGRNDYNSSINYQRYSFRSNIDVNVSPSTILTVNLSNLYEIKNEPGAGRDDSYSGIWPTAFKTSPNAYPPYYMKADGSFDRLAGQPEGTGWNPYNQLMHSGYLQNFYNSMQSIFSLTQDFSNIVTQGLKANVRFSWDAYSNTWVKRLEKPHTYMATGNYNDDRSELIYSETAKGREDLEYSQGSGGSRAIYVEGSITYDRVFADKHRVGALFLYNQRERTVLMAGNSRKAMPYKNQGIAGRVTYAFDDRYFAEANFGYNGSENFSPGKRFGFFPAFALGWMVSNEKFWAPLSNTIDVLKIRGSYGLVGNDQIGGDRRFIYEGTILTDKGGYTFGDQGQSGGGGYREGDIANPNVGWEKSYKTDIGLEMSLFRVLKIQADYFNEDREGIFVQRKGLPGIAGNTNVPWSNVGKMNNRGFDGSLEYSQRFGDFLVSARGNFTYNYSKIIDNDEPAWKYPYQGSNGRKYGQPTGLVALGFFKSEAEIAQSPEQQFGGVRPGDIKYADINGDGIVDSDDAVPIGNPEIPQISYGFGASVNWKGLDLSVFFQGIGKVSLFAEGNALYGIVASDIRANGMMKDLYYKRWQEGADNSHALYPRLTDGTNQNNDRRSTLRMHDGSFLRLKNAEIGYTLPKVWMDKIRFNSVRIYVSGVNLLTFSKFKVWDPEKGTGQGMGYPPNRIINFGINMNF